MKQFIIIISALFTIALFSNAQPPELFSRNWKMEKMITVHNGATTTLFNKDSLSNALDYSSFKYKFFNTGTYTATSDTTSNQGTWALNLAGDSAVLDSVPFALTELTSTHFTTRGFSLNLLDSTGAFDTSYTYVFLYPAPVLPVTLVNFTATYFNNLVKLNWSTAQEQQSKEFQVQYSSNATDFETIGTVPSKGNSTAPTDYAYSTNHYQTGKNYYRLKQVDMDGHTSISPVATVDINASGQFTISLSPNPASNKLVFSIGQVSSNPLQLVLTTVAGQQVFTTALATNTTNATVYLPALAKGVYVAVIVNNKGEKVFYNKLVIQ